MAIKWKNLPRQIQRRMHECQIEQGNPPLEKIFIDLINRDRQGGGFNWSDTQEGQSFWDIVLFIGKIEHFYTLYPKEIIEYSLWM